MNIIGVGFTVSQRNRKQFAILLFEIIYNLCICYPIQTDEVSYLFVCYRQRKIEFHVSGDNHKSVFKNLNSLLDEPIVKSLVSSSLIFNWKRTRMRF